MNELIPILTVASADHATRSKWLERLFEAVQSDGVEYLAPLEDRWGEIAQYPDLINEGLGLMLSRSVSTAPHRPQGDPPRGRDLRRGFSRPSPAHLFSARLGLRTTRS